MFTDENKVVRTYSKGFILQCGGPKLNNDPRWGYRHIIRYHRDDFKRLVSSLLMQRNWRDLTDFVIEWMILEPHNIKAAGGGQTCRDRDFWLVNANGHTVFKQKFRLYTQGNRINSVHPTSRGC